MEMGEGDDVRVCLQRHLRRQRCKHQGSGTNDRGNTHDDDGGDGDNSDGGSGGDGDNSDGGSGGDSGDDGGGSGDGTYRGGDGRVEKSSSSDEGVGNSIHDACGDDNDDGRDKEYRNGTENNEKNDEFNTHRIRIKKSTGNINSSTNRISNRISNSISNSNDINNNDNGSNSTNRYLQQQHPHRRRSIIGDPSLTSIDLSSVNIGQEGCKVLASAVTRNQWLHTLNLEHCQIGTQGM